MQSQYLRRSDGAQADLARVAGSIRTTPHSATDNHAPELREPVISQFILFRQSDPRPAQCCTISRTIPDECNSSLPVIRSSDVVAHGWHFGTHHSNGDNHTDVQHSDPCFPVHQISTRVMDRFAGSQRLTTMQITFAVDVRVRHLNAHAVFAV
jgi:hypothetical protein